MGFPLKNVGKLPHRSFSYRSFGHPQLSFHEAYLSEDLAQQRSCRDIFNNLQFLVLSVNMNENTIIFCKSLKKHGKYSKCSRLYLTILNLDIKVMNVKTVVLYKEPNFCMISKQKLDRLFF